MHVKGIWRRCTLEEYRKPEPQWETVLDLDELSAKEDVTWVWHGSTVLDEGEGVPVERVLLKLSRGGSDACQVREFDIQTKAFISEAEGGFFVGEAKSYVSYKDRDTLWIGTDMGPHGVEGSLTDSGYPRMSYEWKRGTKLSEATRLFEGEKTDVLAVASFSRERSYYHAMRERAITFWTSEYHARLERTGEYLKVPVQADAKLDTYVDQYLIELRSDWTIDGATHPAGSLLAVGAQPFLEGDRSSLTALFTPTASASLAGQTDTYRYLILDVLDHVRSELRFWRCGHSGPQIGSEEPSRGAPSQKCAPCLLQVLSATSDRRGASGGGVLLSFSGPASRSHRPCATSARRHSPLYRSHQPPRTLPHAHQCWRWAYVRTGTPSRRPTPRACGSLSAPSRGRASRRLACRPPTRI